MELADLPEVREEQFSIVEYCLGCVCLVQRAHVARRHLPHVTSELLLRFYQLSDHRPDTQTHSYIVTVAPLVLLMDHHGFPADHLLLFNKTTLS